jgi:DNA polymerase III epsilon subunit-like protein
MALLSTAGRDWLDQENFITYYNRKWIFWANKTPYINLAKQLYNIEVGKNALYAPNLPPPTSQQLHVPLSGALLTFRTFTRLINKKYPYDPNNPKVKPISMAMLAASLFAMLIIDEDWAAITS